jgi:carboxylesterase
VTVNVWKTDAFRLGPEEGERGVLLLHGFTGTPFEMRLLGDSLAEEGLSVLGPRLSGHAVPGLIAGTRALAATRWPDWLRSADRALDDLRARVDRVMICGLSMGGLLSLELARLRPAEVTAIASLSTPLWLMPAAERGIGWARRLPWMQRLALPKFAGPDICDPEMRAANAVAQGRAAMPFLPVLSLADLQAHLRTRLHEVKAPTLLMHARRDHTAPFACMEALQRELPDARAIALERSFHVITLDVERQMVFDAVREHVLRY